MMKRPTTLFLLFAAFFAGCKKNISVDVKNAPVQVVIEGIVNDVSPITVSISNSVTLGSDNNFPPVSGADVRVSDDAGHLFHLQETKPGAYVNPFLGVPGRTYSLNVLLSGKNYTAVSTMPLPVPLDSLTENRLPFPGEPFIDITPYYMDPKGFGNHYQFVETVNGAVRKSIFVFDDRFSDGALNTRPLVSDSSLKRGDTVNVEMRCIDKNVARYFTALLETLSNSTTPENPPSNISGGCLGYFSAHTSRTKGIRIK